jgi:hypothetical protein
MDRIGLLTTGIPRIAAPKSAAIKQAMIGPTGTETEGQACEIPPHQEPQSRGSVKLVS